jgi:methyl-accepting chemotaxis protein
MEKVKISSKAELTGSLHDLVADTERIFLSLGEQFPKLLSEMEVSFEASNEVLDSLQGDGRLARVVQSARDAVAGAADSFAAMHEQDDRLFSELDGGIKTLGELDSLIGEIKEDSIEMELVSINAMTVALKTGSAGKAFSYITEELKRLSSRTIDLTDTITQRGSTLLSDFREFRNRMAEVKEYQDELFGRFRERLSGSFDAFLGGIERTASVLASIRDTSQSIKQPLSNIMQEVQIQDIIKQSVDHVLISLDELHEVEDSDNEEQLLDELSFLSSLPDLCITLLGDIREQMSASLEVFRRNADEAREIMERAEQDRRDFVHQSMHAGTEERESLEALFTRASRMLDELLSDTHRSMDMKRGLTRDSERLLDEVSEIENAFRSFSTLITRFRSIDIASRIEVAKQEVLQQMSGTVETMNALTHKIERDVNVSLDSTKTFITETSDVIGRYQAVYNDEEMLVVDFETRMKRLSGDLAEAKNTLGARIEGLSLFSDRFVNLFREMKEQLDGLEQLLTRIDTINAQLREVQAAARERMQPLLEARGLTEWRIKSDRLKAMIERFTIFTHKKTAGDIAGFEVEHGAPSGEITMF